MPLAGGPSDKLGNRYEARWTVDRLLDLLWGTCDSIRLEPPALDDRGFEFCLRKGSALHFHQVKRQHSSRGHWSLGDLNQHGVLENFWRKLANPEANCVFVSTQDAPELRELTDRARSAISSSEFSASFLGSGDVEADFGQLRGYWHSQPEDMIYRYLRRVSTETVSERYLLTTVVNRLAVTVDGDPETASDVLFSLVFESVHQELTAYDVWRHIKARGRGERLWSSSPEVLGRVDEQNGRYVSQLRRQAIQSNMIPRDEAIETCDAIIADGGPKAIMLTADAGHGKSTVLLQAVEALQARGVPVLAFRADRLEPKNLPRDVGQQIGLPDSPARVLAAIAQGRTSVLVMDQLDAVSKASGRNPHFYDCLLEIIEQTRPFPNLKLILACRKFDLENDERLRQLTAEKGIAREQQIPAFTPELVKQVVTNLGLDADRLTERQIRLLVAPLHLSLLAQVADSAHATALNFSTLHDLYGRFWDEKQRRIKDRRGAGIQWNWNATMDLLCQQMSDGHCLAVPMSRLDDNEADIDAMVSEHVLVIDGTQCAFFHEGLFDYAFARRFAAKQRTLVDFLCSDEQDLFRRTQVRQILQYLRDEDRSRYLIEIQSLIATSKIRFHLYWLAFAWFAQLTDPTVEEWRILRAITTKQGAFAAGYRNLVVTLLQKSGSWFLLAYQEGDLAAWLAGPDDNVVNRAIDVLASGVQAHPIVAVELLYPFVKAGDQWLYRVKWVVCRALLSRAPQVFELFLAIIEQGGFARVNKVARQDEFWDYLYELSENNPSLASRAIACMLRRSMMVSAATGESNPLNEDRGAMPQSTSGEIILKRSAHGDPSAFVDNVLDLVLQIISVNSAVPTGARLRSDRIWRWRDFHGGYGLASELLSNLEFGLRYIASHEPELFRGITPKLKEGKFETAYFLLLRGYTANGAAFADEAADLLEADPNLLEIGYRSDSHYASTDLLRAISPHCSQGRLSALEQIILNYYADWERSPEGRRSFGHGQFVLLSAIDPQRRSERIRARLMELEHKFGPSRIEEPAAMEFSYVPSPIPQGALEKMTDDQWLRALEKYNGSHSGRKGGLGGGALQLSQDLQAQSQAKPERFARLLRRFPKDVHLYYVSAVLRGLAASKTQSTVILDACEYVYNLEGRPAGQEVCDCIGRLAEAKLPDSALAIVAWYATEDPDPCEETWRQEPDGSPSRGFTDVLTAGINCVRGAAADTVSRLIHARPERGDILQAAIRQMAHDPSVAVRSVVAAALIAMLRTDRDFAVDQFLRLCDAGDAVLGTHYVEEFIHYSVRTHFHRLEPLLMRMLSIADKNARIVGARQACLAAFMLPEARPLLEYCLAGPEDLRLGAAEVAAINVAHASLKTLCTSILTRLFDDDSESVRAKAGECFLHFTKSELGDAEDLVISFVNSAAFPRRHAEVLRALDESTAVLPEATLIMCAKFIELAGGAAGNPAALSGGRPSRLIVRVYGQSADSAFRSRCLDVIDQMLAFAALELPEALAAYER